MKRIVILFILLGLSYSSVCQKNIDSSYIAKRVHDTAFSHHTQYFRMTRKQFRKLHLNFCDTFSFVFTGFYPIEDSLQYAWKETVYLDRLLKAYGFVDDIGGGYSNWEKGPRMMSENLKKDSCHCKVYKLYFNYYKMKDGYYNMEVKEKIVCNEKDPDGWADGVDK